MSNTATFSCHLDTTDPSAAIGLEIWFDNDQIFNVEHLDRGVDLNQTFLDDGSEHEFRFIMKNKTQDMTQIDEAGNIVKDACLTISDAAFDEIKLGHVFFEQVKYCHDFNGTQDLTETQCFGQLGCNGTVSLRFSTPIYTWLLEHM